MVTALRYLEKFTGASGAPVVTFPLLAYEWAPSGGLRTYRSEGVDLNYSYDHLRNAIAPRDVAREEVRFGMAEDTPALTDAAIDVIKGRCLTIGKGKLWTLGSDGTRRWCWARLAAVPEITVSYKRSITAPAMLSFDRYSDWFAENLTTFSQAVVASNATWTINNPGSLPATILTIRFRADGAAGFVNPKLQNMHNGYEVATLRDSASANSEVRLDTERPAIEYSNDDGATYSDDLANYVIPALQAALSFRLEVGDNLLKYTGGGTPNLHVEGSFYAPYA